MFYSVEHGILTKPNFGLQSVPESVEISAGAKIVQIYDIDKALNGGKASELVSVFTTSLPSSIIKLVLINNNLFSCRKADAIARIIASITAPVQSLDLSGNNFTGDAVPDDIAKILASIPAQFSELILGNNRIERFDVEDIIKILNAIPSTINKLTIGCLSGKTVNEKIRILAAIPTSITRLDLSFNGMFNHTVEEMKLIFAALPTSVTDLNIENNGRLTTALPAMPGSISELHLSVGEVRDLNLNAPLPSFPVGIKILHYKISMFELSESQRDNITLAFIPRSVSSLILSYSDALSLIPSILMTIPNTLQLLKLSGINLFGKQIEFASLYDPVNLVPTPISEAIRILSAIPASVFSLDISDTGIQDRSLEDVVKILEALPITVGILICSDLPKGAEDLVSHPVFFYRKAMALMGLDPLTDEFISGYDPKVEDMEKGMEWLLKIPPESSLYAKAARHLWPRLYYQHLEQKSEGDCSLTLENVYDYAQAASEVKDLFRACHPGALEYINDKVIDSFECFSRLSSEYTLIQSGQEGALSATKESLVSSGAAAIASLPLATAMSNMEPKHRDSGSSPGHA
ncbi:MAG: hypothetical protein K0R66_1677 [Gammaproteobacteria bacterium]|jgi:hypothetical protein|nr:hypothetical protein [Gammaproteobacteria bacterium]